MTLYLDASALVARHLSVPARQVTIDAMSGDPAWCSSMVSLAEALLLVDRVTDEAILREDLEDAIRRDWDRMYTVPLDQRCLDRATELARAQPLRLADAIHLAAAERLPRPTSFVTFDPNQIPVALSMGFDVIST